MFCSGCGKEIPEGSKFCPGCGKATDGSPNPANTFSDPKKILKEGEFRRVEKTMDAMSKKNDGKFTLFCDRFEWRGKVNDDVKIDDIAEVLVPDLGGGDTALRIIDNAGKVYNYYRMHGAFAGFDGGRTGFKLTLSDKKAEMESWRAAIDKLRGRL